MDVIHNLTFWANENGTASDNTAWFSGTWVMSIIAACAVGMTGVVPLAIVPDFKCKNGEESRFLRLLLSFAVGSLLGDVFLHLLPEAWHALHKDGDCSESHVHLGVFVLIGIFTFMAVEMMFTVGKEEDEKEEDSKMATLSSNQDLHEDSWNKEVEDSSNCLTQRRKPSKPDVSQSVSEVNTRSSSKHISGYLNLIANAIDNFSHGLAVAASFIVGPKMGILTTAAILIHEIPHEVGDFAILLKAGFNRWEAAKAQLSTAAIGVAGALFALSANSIEDVGRSTIWILPFTAGGFLNIALVSILPDLMKERDPRESFKQVLAIFLGITVMGAVGVLTD